MDFTRQPGGVAQYTLTLTVQGIDAFTTPGELEELWNAMVLPLQKTWRLNLAQVAFHQKHGRFPSLKEFDALRRSLTPRAKPPFTKPMLYLPLWKLMHKEPLFLDQARNKLSWVQDFDRRNAQRGVKRLEELMKPYSE